MNQILKEDIDINKVRIQKEEVSAVKWATINDIEKMIEEGDFSESHRDFFEDCIKYLNAPQ